MSEKPTIEVPCGMCDASGLGWGGKSACEWCDGTKTVLALGEWVPRSRLEKAEEEKDIALDALAAARQELPTDGPFLDDQVRLLRQRAEKAEEALGLADELRSRLPEPKRVGDELLRPDLCIAVEDGEWEIEFCPLDVKRNICLRRPSLTEALQAVLNHDDEALASHPEEPK